MPAPALKVAKWFKGTPVERLDAGQPVCRGVLGDLVRALPQPPSPT